MMARVKLSDRDKSALCRGIAIYAAVILGIWLF